MYRNERRTMAVYTLPDLDYDYGALAPHIAPEIMELHHSKHHATYVAGANTALEKLAEAREKNDFGAVNKLEKDLAFHLGGHINHSVFWKNMSPDGGGRPDGELASAIDEYFRSFEGFQNHFNENAKALQGSGWSMLVWDLLGKRLNVAQLFDQQGNLPAGQVPLLQLDMWEHAYYLQYKNVKGDYVTAWWNVVNWADAAQRFAKAKAADLI
jgi:superoxide dismutase, Fe-Mn family